MNYDFSKEYLVERLLKINRNILLIVTLIFILGTMMLYSASNGSMKPWAIRQIIYYLAFFPFCIFVAVTNINFWFRTSYIIYFVCLVMLLLVSLFGHKSMGATRWINFGSIRIQPSEFMKIGLILALARYFFQHNLSEIRENKKLIIPILLFIFPFILILKQPSLGTAVILMAITVAILFFVGVQMWKFFLCFFLVICTTPVVWKFALHDYQRQRVMTFLNPDSDPLNSGYNITQSKIAIGSGGIWGKGFLKGTQGQLEFLPEKHTDFIFTILCEEFGFVGAIFTITLFLILFSMMLYIITKCTHSYGKIIVGGVFINLFCHFFINIGMVTGILPVVGTPLPLFSYGGSITVSTLISIGFVLNVDINRDDEIRLSI